MLAFTRLCMLAVSLSLLLNVSLAASLQYSFYNGTTCAGTATASGTDSNPTYGTQGGTSVWSGSCVAVSGVSGIATTKLVCTSGSTSTTGALFYSDAACANPTFISVSGSTGSGSCVAVSGLSYSASMTITCNGNGALTVAALSIPLMAVLALLATLSM